MSENKTSKYFKYAIGEILLVMIGILLALQVNNWNEEKKTKKTEFKLLHELKDDLLETTDDLLTDIDKAELLLITTDSLFQWAIKNNWEKLKISMDYIYDTPKLFPKLSAYKSIQAYGVNIVSNDSLRKMVTNFYELHLERVNYGESLLKELNEKEIKQHLDNISLPGSHCLDCESLFELYANDIKRQQNYYHVNEANIKIAHMLKEKFTLVDGLNKRYSDTKRQIENMLDIINEELLK